MKELPVIVFEQIGGTAAVSTEDGENLYQRIDAAFSNDIHVVLDFNNIDLMTSAFLNASIGRLYSKYDNPFIREHLKVTNMASDDLVLLKRVVERAKEYFERADIIDNVIRDSLGDE